MKLGQSQLNIMNYIVKSHWGLKVIQCLPSWSSQSSEFVLYKDVKQKQMEEKTKVVIY